MPVTMFHPNHVQLLLDLLNANADNLFIRLNNNMTVINKSTEWCKLCDQYRALSGNHEVTPEKLIKKWDNLKTKLRSYIGKITRARIELGLEHSVNTTGDNNEINSSTLPSRLKELQNYVDPSMELCWDIMGRDNPFLLRYVDEALNMDWSNLNPSTSVENVNKSSSFTDDSSKPHMNSDSDIILIEDIKDECELQSASDNTSDNMLPIPCNDPTLSTHSTFRPTATITRIIPSISHNSHPELANAYPTILNSAPSGYYNSQQSVSLNGAAFDSSNTRPSHLRAPKRRQQYPPTFEPLQSDISSYCDNYMNTDSSSPEIVRQLTCTKLRQEMRWGKEEHRLRLEMLTAKRDYYLAKKAKLNQ